MKDTKDNECRGRNQKKKKAILGKEKNNGYCTHTQTHTQGKTLEREKWTKRDDLIGDGSPPFPPKAAKKEESDGMKP